MFDRHGFYSQLLVERVSPTYHGGSDNDKSDRPILWRVVHADGALVLGELIGKGGVDGDGVDSVQAAWDICDAFESGASQEVEPVIVLQPTPFAQLTSRQ